MSSLSRGSNVLMMTKLRSLWQNDKAWWQSNKALIEDQHEEWEGQMEYMKRHTTKKKRRWR
jgi:hypothetical protein